MILSIVERPLVLIEEMSSERVRFSRIISRESMLSILELPVKYSGLIAWKIEV